MTQTTNYSLNKPQGSDLFAPLTDYNPNWDAIDAAMYENQMASVPRATEAIAATVHNITRNVPDAAMFRFTATGNVGTGDTFTVDGIAVSAIAANGQAIAEGAWLTGTEVLACLNGNVCTFYVSASSSDAETLQGHAASYFGTAAGVEAAQNTATAAGNVANQASVAANNAIAIAQAAGISITKIWENPSPTSAFADQTLALTNMPDNVKFFIVMQVFTSGDRPQIGCTGIVVPGVQTMVMSMTTNGSNDATTARYYTFDNAAKTVVIAGRASVSSGWGIPLAIYAVK